MPMPYRSPISRQRAQPSTAGASISMIRLVRGSEHAETHVSAPSFINSTTSASFEVATTSSMRFITSASTASTTAANSSVLSANW